jgi:hypothetical protein
MCELEINAMVNCSMPRQNIGKLCIDFVQSLEAERALAGAQPSEHRQRHGRCRAPPANSG